MLAIWVLDGNQIFKIKKSEVRDHKNRERLKSNCKSVHNVKGRCLTLSSVSFLMAEKGDFLGVSDFQVSPYLAIKPKG